MVHKLVYIDDNKANRETFAKGLTTRGLIEIEAIEPDGFEATLRYLIAEQDKFDGLILDLRLDEMDEGKQYAIYTAPSLALAIRSELASSNSPFKKDFPIFLLTSETKLSQSYNAEFTSYEFDDIFFKQDLGQYGKDFELKISNLVSSYQVISANKELGKLLDIDLEILSEDVVPSKFKHTEHLTTHEVSQFIKSQLIYKSGVLIGEEVLAARLGVDIQISSDWVKLKECLKELQYTGVYSEIWERWWQFRFLNWWRREFPNSKPLISLKAVERVNLLKAKYQLNNLEPAKPIQYATGEKFWTVCKALNLPLDTIDGFLLEDEDSKAWHDKQYISFQSIYERDYKTQNLIIHSSEKERIQDIKEKMKS